MNDSKNPETHGKISTASAGLGVPSPELVEQRARELAAIAGRSASGFTEEDFHQAKSELLGEASDHALEETASVVASLTEREVPVGIEGVHIPNIGPADENSIGEELVAEGVDEAAHDQMVEARKNRE